MRLGKSAAAAGTDLAIRLLGTGHALPKAHRKTQEIEQALGLAKGQLEAKTGVISRPVAQGDEDQISLALSASKAALARAGIAAKDLSLVIGACAVPYQPLPATAPLIAGHLGVGDGQLAAFDVNSSCLSFVTGFEIASRMLRPGQSALIVSSELASRALPWQSQPEVAALFGDGAGAAVIQAADTEGGGRLKACLTRSYPSGWTACSIGAGGTRYDFHNDPEAFAANAEFQMEGRSLFRLTARYFGGFVTDLLAMAGWQAGDVDLVIPHQASPFALAHMIALTGFAKDRVMDISATFGNQIAASIPITLDIARQEGRLREGQKLLFLGTSAGVSFGGMALEL